MALYERTIWQDHVKDQYGNVIQKGTPLSAKNMNNIEEGVDIGVNASGAVTGELLHQINALKKEQDKNVKQRFQQGEVYLYNKFIKVGCIINKMANSRYIEVCRTGTFTNGDMSTVYVDGKIITINDEQTILMIPQNNTASSKVFFIYVDYLDNKYRLNISEIEPVGKLILYKATVPSNDLRPDLNSVTLTDMRKIINNSFIRNTEPFSVISLPGHTMNDLNYKVDVTIDSATDLQAVGDVTVYDKQLNGFKIKITGNADNVKLAWNIVETRVK